MKTEDGKPNAGLSRIHKTDSERCGTGDVFSGIIAVDSVNGIPFEKSVNKAPGFVRQCIKTAVEQKTPPTDGVPFEEILYQLKRGLA